MTMTSASKICRLSNTSNKSLIHSLYILLWAKLAQSALPNAHCADCSVQKLHKCNMIYTTMKWNCNETSENVSNRYIYNLNKICTFFVVCRMCQRWRAGHCLLCVELNTTKYHQKAPSRAPSILLLSGAAHCSALSGELSSVECRMFLRFLIFALFY